MTPQSKSCKLRCVAISDLHLGRPYVPPEKVQDNLRTFLYPHLQDIAILFLCGDFFDTLLNMSSVAGVCAASIIDELITLALQNNFYIRVLKGTFSHDRFQNRFFLVKDGGAHELHGVPLVRVIENIEVERIEPIDLTILYCPDDQPYPDVTQALLDTLKQYKRSSVDFLCSHGYFEHLLPKGIPHIPHNTLSLGRIRSRIRGMILNGHVHTPSVHGKVINIGSFERFEHGSEETKGFFIINYDTKTADTSYEFIVNEKTIPFNTFIASSYVSLDEMCVAITNHIAECRGLLGDDAKLHIRIFGNTPDVSDWVRTAFDNIIVTDKHAITPTALSEDIDVSCGELPIVTPENLATMISVNLPDGIHLTLQEIQEILDGCT